VLGGAKQDVRVIVERGEVSVKGLGDEVHGVPPLRFLHLRDLPSDAETFSVEMPMTEDNINPKGMPHGAPSQR
jgi:hypothetical protein